VGERKELLVDAIGARSGDARAAVADRVFGLRSGLAERARGIGASVRRRGGRGELRPAFAYAGNRPARTVREEPAEAVERKPEAETRPVAEARAEEPTDATAVISEALERAHAGRVALSVVAVGTPVAAERLVRALQDIAPAPIAARAAGDYVVVEGVTPKRTTALVAAVATTTDLAGSSSGEAAVGVAGFPRHGRAADELVRLARRAAESAAATGEPVRSAETSWRADE
jgi:hypothetical protein